uniref:Putative inorganic phosphate cotransporter n=1 Tax=Haematobia irritans TaxID=7368 RepID=A0A1L8EAI1_HAEIR
MTVVTDKGPVFGQRHVQAVLLFTCLAVNYLTKYNASICVVAMTNAATTNPNFPEYDWSPKEKSYILSSYFWGYIVTQFPGGNICRRFGVKATLLVCTLGSSLAGLVVPLTVDWGGWKIYCAVRVIQGMFQGLNLPCVHAHLAMWSPVEERNRLGALASSGTECGIVLSIFVSGRIAASNLGWPGIFYIFCGVGVIWCFIWMFFASNTPSESKFITENERNYIESSKNAMKEKKESEMLPQSIPVPWKAILCSTPFWALLVVRSAESWGFATIQGQMPTYMNGVYGMDMKSNALYSALPYLALWSLTYVYLLVADILLNRKILSLNALRKLINSIGFWVPSIGLIAVGFIENDQQTAAVALMIGIVGINAGNVIGSNLNTIDLSPNHAGVLMSLVHASASIWPMVAPIMVAAIVQDESDRTEWQIVFAIAAAVFFFGNLIYIIFGTTNLQKWDDPYFLQDKSIPVAASFVDAKHFEEVY